MFAALRPTFSAMMIGDSYLVEITPPEVFNATKKKVKLTKEEYETGLVPFLQGKKLIQEAFPDKSDSFREMFLSGMDDAEWQAKMGNDDDD
jgi:hypothetical protein